MKPSTRAHIVVCHVAKKAGTRSHWAYSLEERKHNCDQILENLPFGHKQTLDKTQLKTFTIVFKLNFFAHLDKATCKLSYCEVSHQKLLSSRRYG